MKTEYTPTPPPSLAQPAVSQRPVAQPTRPTVAAWRQVVHRTGGMVLALYALIHLGNHLVALRGVAAHQQAMESLRLFYRHPLVEPLLLVLVLAQVVSGAWGALGVLRQRGAMHPVARMQALSGLVLGTFVLIHISAVLVGRLVMQLDTNFYYAAAGLHVPPYGWFFAPYYFGGVGALGVHLGCAAYWALQKHRVVLQVGMPVVLGLLGVLVGGVLVVLMAGGIVPVRVPAAYLATYGV